MLDVLTPDKTRNKTRAGVLQLPPSFQSSKPSSLWKDWPAPVDEGLISAAKKDWLWYHSSHKWGGIFRLHQHCSGWCLKIHWAQILFIPGWCRVGFNHADGKRHSAHGSRYSVSKEFIYIACHCRKKWIVYYYFLWNEQHTGYIVHDVLIRSLLDILHIRFLNIHIRFYYLCQSAHAGYCILLLCLNKHLQDVLLPGICKYVSHTC